MTLRRLISLCLGAAALLTGCRDDRIDPAMLESTAVRLEVAGQVVFTYDPLTGQLSYDPDRHIFRAGTDNMSDCFVITCSDLPTAKGQELRGSASWTTEAGEQSRHNLTFRVEKAEGATVWLWAPRERIGAVVRILP